jgi:hypothetical protein
MSMTDSFDFVKETGSEKRKFSVFDLPSDRIRQMPVRIQRKRTKGWRMPENTVYVGRPTKWGNPWTVEDTYSPENCVDNYRLWVAHGLPITYEKHRQLLFCDMVELRGKNLACWCRLDQPCHADVLLEVANR